MWYIVYDRGWKIIPSFKHKDYERRGITIYGPFTFEEAQAALADMDSGTTDRNN
jgi:hypothetical protein